MKILISARFLMFRKRKSFLIVAFLMLSNLLVNWIGLSKPMNPTYVLVPTNLYPNQNDDYKIAIGG